MEEEEKKKTTKKVLPSRSASRVEVSPRPASEPSRFPSPRVLSTEEQIEMLKRKPTTTIRLRRATATTPTGQCFQHVAHVLGHGEPCYCTRYPHMDPEAIRATTVVITTKPPIREYRTMKHAGGNFIVRLPVYDGEFICLNYVLDVRFGNNMCFGHPDGFHHPPPAVIMELYGHLKTVLVVGMIDGSRLDAAEGRLGLFSSHSRHGPRVQVLCEVPEDKVMPQVGQVFDSRAVPAIDQVQRPRGPTPGR